MNRSVCCVWREAGRFPCWKSTISQKTTLGSSAKLRDSFRLSICPNAKRPELRHLYDHHPDLWARMLELQAIPEKATEKFNRTQRFSDIDALFRQEDQDALQSAA